MKNLNFDYNWKLVFKTSKRWHFFTSHVLLSHVCCEFRPANTWFSMLHVHFWSCAREAHVETWLKMIFWAFRSSLGILLFFYPILTILQCELIILSFKNVFFWVLCYYEQLFMCLVHRYLLSSYYTGLNFKWWNSLVQNNQVLFHCCQ